MGSFDVTCCVSGLPISPGEKVRIFFLSRNPYVNDGNSSSFCEMTGDWFPRCFPIQAIYDDYGRVKNFQPSWTESLIQDGFNLDMIERGIGDNVCHDVSTSKKMDLASLIDAAYEGRLIVSRDIGSSLSSRLRAEKILPGLPTRKKVEKALINAGLPISTGMGIEGNMVTSIRRGEVRVRYECTGVNWDKDDEFLLESQKVLTDYATVIKAGKTNCKAELLVFVKPGTKDFHGYHKTYSKKPLLVKTAMIREDVWNALCSKIIDYEYGKIQADRKQFHLWGQQAWKKSLQAAYDVIKANELRNKNNALSRLDPEKIKSFADQGLSLEDKPWETSIVERISYYGGGGNDRNPLMYTAAHDIIPFTIGLGSHWALMIVKFIKNEITQKQVNVYLKTISEFTMITMALSPVRYYWRPTYSVGPQTGEWREHEIFHTMLSSLSKKEADVQDAERAEY